MDKEEKWVNINIDGHNNRAIGYNQHSLQNPTNGSDGSFEEYLINA